MRIHVLVNGTEKKTNGVRARELFHDLASQHEVSFFYRDDERKVRSAKEFLSAIRRFPPDIVYVEGIGYAGILPVVLEKALSRTRFLVSTGDAAYAFARSCMNIVKAQFVGAMEFVALRTADAVIVWGPYHKELLEERGFRNVFWIPGGVDTSLFRPLDVRALRNRLSIGPRITIGVVGSINFNRKHSFCYGWEVIEALRLLRGQPVVGLIIGVGDGIPFLKLKAREYGVEDQVIFTGWVDHHLLPQYINLIDVCISTQSNDLVGRVRITAKVPEYLACGRYIIASDVGGARTFVKDCGLLLPYSGVKDSRYVKAIAHHVSRICDDRSVLEVGKRGVEVAKRHFDYPVLRLELEKAIRFVQTKA
jgi:glycosyltransferase involved in cell wall biosynthesis